MGNAANWTDVSTNGKPSLLIDDEGILMDELLADELIEAALAAGRVLTDVQIRASNAPIPPLGVHWYELLGYWDVDTDQSWKGEGTDGRTGHYMMSLFARWTERTPAECVEDVWVKASNSSTAPAPPSGFVRIGRWDVDKGGSRGTDNSYGNYMMGMYIKKTSNPNNCIRDLQLRASNASTPKLIPGYSLVGYWDVDHNTNYKSRGTDNSFGRNMMSLSYLK